MLNLSMSKIAKIPFNKIAEEDKMNYLLKTYFSKGWNDTATLDYLQKTESHLYDKVFDWDCLEMVKRIVTDIREHCITDETEQALEYWIDALCSVLPYDDKAIDYFLSHNTTYALLVCWLRNSATDGIKDAMIFHQIVMEQCKMEMLMEAEGEQERLMEKIESLKEMDVPIEEFTSQMVKDIEPYVHKEKNPNIYRAKRNQEIIDKADARRGQTPVSKVYEDIADDYLEISHHQVKKIVQAGDSTPSRLKKDIIKKQ